MFEKSLYDLIRGLRHHRGSEREYIQNSLRECRIEIKSQDMDRKATALLKLIYLEMFGHDMSWASFNVLEVMSSSKYLQKRVGYLGAVQSFRPETEVLMLATNLLKKDITSASVPTICLPLVTVPHVITPSLALSLVSDLLPRLSHSSPSVRKKTVVTLYRLALVYPDALRSAWSKIKAILMDDDEDPAVTAAAINVICELGWRRPQDFLPLAPRLFDLLVHGGNNWMAIKIIKLFATLTPLEPRLIKKLLPPLTNLIRSTSAMSLLYECIHGIIQGGILDNGDAFSEREEVAELCVSKLQEMISIEGDPNLKYVALLSFNSISRSHPYLIASHQEAILDCLDDPDVSIRSQALELCFSVVNTDNLSTIVDTLMRQLRDTPVANNSRQEGDGPTNHIEPSADLDSEDPSEALRPDRAPTREMDPLPPEYCATIIERILDMCSRDTYANVLDFHWYVETIIELAGYVPREKASNGIFQGGNLSMRIGAELRNVTVRVVSIRAQGVKAAAALITSGSGQSTNSSFGSADNGMQQCATWIVGEYASLLPDPNGILDFFLRPVEPSHHPNTLCAFLQAIPKLLSMICSRHGPRWDAEQRAVTDLLLTRVIHFLEPLAAHSSFEVQERASEFLELFRVTRESVQSYDKDYASAPVLLTIAIPALFGSADLGPVASSAQSKIPIPQDLELDGPINRKLQNILAHADSMSHPNEGLASIQGLYYVQASVETSKSNTHFDLSRIPTAYAQAAVERSISNQQSIPIQRLERTQRVKDDPFYIEGADRAISRSMPFHEIMQHNNNGQTLDIDAIPIMDLDLGIKEEGRDMVPSLVRSKQPRERVQVTADENIEFEGLSIQSDVGISVNRPRQQKGLLQIDSGGLTEFKVLQSEEMEEHRMDVVERKGSEEMEMARALAEVDRLRMEMQRASERVEAGDIPDDGNFVKKKRKKKMKKAKKDSIRAMEVAGGVGD